ncbi:hypothetical protein ACFSX9_06610 [Flavobacterium ardleyense]|uniref:Lipoprotein n=1 Tax=Flavobacterium ardleyense TaxID=2038737 RepID=A0ABW5Z9D8_9FLAO
MKKIVALFILAVALFSFFSCEDVDDKSEERYLIVKFKFDADQVRLDNLGQPSILPSENGAQSPNFNAISAHYFELAPNAYTQLGDGTVLYHAPETTEGGEVAIDFDQSIVVKEGEAFLKIPLRLVTQGSYEYVRVSLSYQDYNISVRNNGADYQARLASFVGYNTFINTHFIESNSFPINGNSSQGYWAFALNDFPFATSGQAPTGLTTVPNPIASTSPIPAGSCVVTGKFSKNLVINGNENKDVVVTLSLSINKSFEWQELTTDGKFEPAIGENVLDMGLRGLIPTHSK